MNDALGGLSKPYRRALALTLLAIIVLFIFATVIEPWLSASLAHGRRMARLSAELETRQSMAERIPALEARLAALESDPQSGKRLLPGANPALAAASLQGALRHVLSSSKAQIVSVEGLPGESASKGGSGSARIAARITVRGDETELRDVLHGIETAVPFLYVQRLQVNAAGGKVADVKSAASHLIVTVEVFGYWRAQALSAEVDTGLAQTRRKAKGP